jgi:superfamily II DNA or RNA helicase
MTVNGQCHLADISQDLLRIFKDKLTIDNPKYHAAKKYGRWIGRNFQQKLIFYEINGNTISFPRGYAAQAVNLCKKHMGQGPRIIDRRRCLPEVDFNFQGELRSYQDEAVSDILQKHFGVLVAGTGSGKTVMALAVLARRRQPTLILLHSKELMYQWQERIDQFLGIKAGLIGDGKFDIQPVSVAIVNTARKRLPELKDHFGHLIVDECHLCSWVTVHTRLIRKSWRPAVLC